jgi:hypothetical protein
MASEKKLIRFATRDGGWVFVDPETDKVVRVVKGKRRELPANTDWSHDLGRAAREDAAIVVPTARPLAGSRQNNRGNTVIIDPDAIHAAPYVAGEEHTKIFQIVDSIRNGGEDAEDILVTLGRQYVNEVAPFIDTATSRYVLDHKAVVEWGNGNAVYQLECDFERGSTFGVCASYVEVKDKVIFRTPVLGPGKPPLEQVSVSIGYGRTTRNKLKLTQRVEFVGGAVTVALEPPPFATELEILYARDPGDLVPPVLPTAVIVTFSNNVPDEIANTYDIVTHPVLTIPATYNRVQVTVIAGLAAPPASMAVVWYLAV